MLEDWRLIAGEELYIGSYATQESASTECLDTVNQFQSQYRESWAGVQPRLEFQEKTKLLDHSKPLSKGVQRLASANVALNSEVRRLSMLLQERGCCATEAEEDLQEENRQLVTQNAQLKDQHQQSAGQPEEINLLRSSIEERIHDTKNLQKEVGDLRDSLAERDERLRQAISHEKVLSAALDDVHASGSWRITQPLRAAYDMLRSLCVFGR